MLLSRDPNILFSNYYAYEKMKIYYGFRQIYRI